MKTAVNPVISAFERAREFNRIARSLIKRNMRSDARKAYRAKRRVLLHLICVLGHPFCVATDDTSLLRVGSRPSLHMVRQTQYLFPRYETQLARLIQQILRIIAQLRGGKRRCGFADALDLVDRLDASFDVDRLRTNLANARSYASQSEFGAALFEARRAWFQARRLYDSARKTELSAERSDAIESAIQRVESEVAGRVSAPSLIRLFKEIDAASYSTRDICPLLKTVQQVGILSRSKADIGTVRGLLKHLRTELLSRELGSIPLTRPAYQTQPFKAQPGLAAMGPRFSQSTQGNMIAVRLSSAAIASVDNRADRHFRRPR